MNITGRWATINGRHVRIPMECICSRYAYGDNDIWRNFFGIKKQFKQMSNGDVYKGIVNLRRKHKHKLLHACCKKYLDERLVCLTKEFNKRMKLTYKE